MFKKKIFIPIFVVLNFVLCWLLYNAIGYLIWGINTPQIYGNGHNTSFMGMYLMSITYFVIFAIILTVELLYLIKYKKFKNKVLTFDFL